MQHCFPVRLALPFLALTAFLLVPRSAHAQLLEQGDVTLLAGFSYPTGKFASTDQNDEESGYASLGFGVTGEYTYHTGTPGLGIVGSVSVIANGLDENEVFEGVDDDEVNYSSGYWINVPIMAGLRYKTEASPTVDMYGLAQAGVNVNRGPTIEAEITANGNTATSTASFGTATSLSFALGAGAVFEDQINVSLRYLRLGTPELTTETETQLNGDTVETDEGEEYDQPLTGLQLLIGIDM